MPTPVITDELFKFSDNILPYVEDDAIIIDNVYENFHQIADFIQNGMAPNWKMSDTTRNFKDYYDCRPIIPIHYSDKNVKQSIHTILKLIELNYSIKNLRCTNTYRRDFNVFKHIRLPSQDRNMQFYPHRDSKFAAITTFDSICSGGTAIYDIDFELENLEAIDLFYDVTDIPRKVIQSKSNRMIIFKATQWHGAYIEDHSKYLNDWRINEVLFFD